MERTLHFRGVQFADGVVKIEPALAPQTALGILSGLYFEAASVVSDSRNLLYALEVTVHNKEASELAFARAALTLQQYAGLSGLMQVKDGATVKINWVECWLMAAPKPDVLEGFGGRFTPAWVFTFVGPEAPEFP